MLDGGYGGPRSSPQARSERSSKCRREGAPENLIFRGKVCLRPSQKLRTPEPDAAHACRRLRGNARARECRRRPSVARYLPRLRHRARGTQRQNNGLGQLLLRTPFRCPPPPSTCEATRRSPPVHRDAARRAARPTRLAAAPACRGKVGPRTRDGSPCAERSTREPRYRRRCARAAPRTSVPSPYPPATTRAPEPATRVRTRSLPATPNPRRRGSAKLSLEL